MHINNLMTETKPAASPSPIVSIGLPVYNGETFLKDTLESILQQTFSNFELIISDNASTDATEKICKSFASKDERIRYHRNESNLGLLKTIISWLIWQKENTLSGQLQMT